MKQLTILFLSSLLFVFEGNAQENAWDSNRGAEKTVGNSFKITINNLVANEQIIIDNSLTIPSLAEDSLIISFLKLPNNKLQLKYRDKTDTLLNIMVQFKIIKNGNELVIKFSGDDIKPIKKESVKNIFADAQALKISANHEKIFKKYKWKAENELLPKSAGIKPSKGQGELESASIGKISGLDVTKYADGLAKFIVGRVKNELAVSFFNKITEKLEGENMADGRVLFKNTYSELKLIGEKIYDYNAYLPAIKQSFNSDLSKIPFSIKKLVENDSSQISKQLDNQKNLRFFTNLGFGFVNDLNNEVHIGDALQNIEVNTVPKKTDTTVVGVVKSLQLLSMALKNNANVNYWVTKAQIKSLVTDSLHFRYFMGLVAHEAQEMKIILGGKELFQIIMEQHQNLEQFEVLVNSLGQTTHLINELKVATNAQKSIEKEQMQFQEYLELASDILQNVKLFKPYLKNSDAEIIDKLADITQSISQIISNYNQKRYANSLVYFSKLLSQIDSTDGKLIELINFLSTRGQFIAQLAEAETSDQVSQIIENFAAPAGSWRDKRHTKFNIALDSYLGPTHYLQNKNKFGISTPIGISFTFPFEKNGKIITIMPSLFDIGPITASRFSNNATDIPKIYLKEILSPGIFSSFSFGKNFPINLNAGYQSLPLLEKVAQNNTVSLIKKAAFSINFNINVPIITLVNQNE